MKPPAFEYADPDTLEGALELLAERGDDTAVLSGGQSLIPLLNLRLARPDLVLDLRRIEALQQWSLGPDELQTGAMVRVGALSRADEVAVAMPGLHCALRSIGHRQIRERTTVGGSLAHADPAAELPAVLAGHEGTVRLQSAARGAREVAAHDFFGGPFMTARAADELVTAVRFPRLAARSTVVEVARRPGDFAIAGAFVAVGECVARIALFGVHDRPVRVPAAEQAVLDGAPAAEVADIVRDMVSTRADLHASADHRRHLAGTVVARALAELAR